MSAYMEVRGNTKNADAFLASMIHRDLYSSLARLADNGVSALAANTPRRTGVTAESWSYEIVHKGDRIDIYWTNSNENNGFNVAVGLQYGHGTKNGGYVAGIDYINPALRPIFEAILDSVWEEVQSA